MVCSQPYTPGQSQTQSGGGTQPVPLPGQQQASSGSGGGSLIILGFIGLLGLMYFAGRK